nr:guanine nucleotide-binding protein subunit beta-2 [Tanacetum cinerariifolium]
MGYVFVVNGGVVDWKSKKQTTIAIHATQSEYMAASKAAMEAVWIRKFIGDLGVMPSINKPINMYYDNPAAIIFTNEPGVINGNRHFLRRYHYVREQKQKDNNNDESLTYIFPKCLSSPTDIDGNIPVSRLLSRHKGCVSSCEYLLDDDNHLITTFGDRLCVLWDITTGLRISVFGGEFQSGHTADVE